jgi:hypothetical protein
VNARLRRAKLKIVVALRPIPETPRRVYRFLYRFALPALCVLYNVKRGI